jgi:hypothetical protein
VKYSVFQECKAVFAAKYAPLLPTEAEISALI